MRWKFWTKLLISLLLLFAVLVFLSPSFHDKYFGVAKYEADAVGSLVKINSLEKQYAASHPHNGFACELVALRPQERETDTSGQVSGLLNGQRSGFKFAFAACAPAANGIVTQYQIFAVPVRQTRSLGSCRSFPSWGSCPDGAPAKIPRLAVRVNRLDVGLNKRNLTKSLYLDEAAFTRDRLGKDATVLEFYRNKLVAEIFQIVLLQTLQALGRNRH